MGTPCYHTATPSQLFKIWHPHTGFVRTTNSHCNRFKITRACVLPSYLFIWNLEWEVQEKFLQVDIIAMLLMLYPSPRSLHLGCHRYVHFIVCLVFLDLSLLKGHGIEDMPNLPSKCCKGKLICGPCQRPILDLAKLQFP